MIEEKYQILTTPAECLQALEEIILQFFAGPSHPEGIDEQWMCDRLESLLEGPLSCRERLEALTLLYSVTLDDDLAPELVELFNTLLGSLPATGESAETETLAVTLLKTIVTTGLPEMENHLTAIAGRLISSHSLPADTDPDTLLDLVTAPRAAS